LEAKSPGTHHKVGNKTPPCTKRILEQVTTSGIKFTSDCPMSVSLFYFIHTGNEFSLQNIIGVDVKFHIGN
jgi:hypothetical protein